MTQSILSKKISDTKESAKFAIFIPWFQQL